MFTGIISEVGIIRSVHPGPPGLELEIESSFSAVAPGESIAVDGVCLTAARVGPGWFSANVVEPTLDRTRFRAARAGDRVNLERALRAGDPLGGHLVQGHVDAVGRVGRVVQRADARIVDLEVPVEVAQVTVARGSIAVDGVSLTVVEKPGPNVVRVSLVPFTLQATTLGRLSEGDRVHLEGDLIGKYVAALLEKREGT